MRDVLLKGIADFRGRPSMLPRAHAGCVPTANAKAALAELLVDEEDPECVWDNEDWSIETRAADGPDAFRVTIWKGDAGTGKSSRTPRPVSEKGPQAQHRIGINQLVLASGPEWSLPEPEPGDLRTLVVVLYRFELKGDRYELSFEVSIPDGYSQVDKTITGWSARYALTTLKGSLSDPSPPEGETFESGVDADPEATRV